MLLGFGNDAPSRQCRDNSIVEIRVYGLLNFLEDVDCVAVAPATAAQCDVFGIEGFLRFWWGFKQVIGRFYEVIFIQVPGVICARVMRQRNKHLCFL